MWLSAHTTQSDTEIVWYHSFVSLHTRHSAFVCYDYDCCESEIFNRKTRKCSFCLRWKFPVESRWTSRKVVDELNQLLVNCSCFCSDWLLTFSPKWIHLCQLPRHVRRSKCKFEHLQRIVSISNHLQPISIEATPEGPEQCIMKNKWFSRSSQISTTSLCANGGMLIGIPFR